MAHIFILNKINPVMDDGRDYICSICGLKVFERKFNQSVYKMYTVANGIIEESKHRTYEDNTELITCEEFIIKKIIE